jgi:putative heme-binding domain-containing protein
MRASHPLAPLSTAILTCLLSLAAAARPVCADEADQSGVFDDYNQWKQALGAKGAVDAARLAVLPGFEVELLRSAGKDEGSWVSLAFDPKGRILIGREDRGILRLTLPTKAGEPQRLETVNDTLRECRGLLWAYDGLYANANNDKALYRLRDTDGDDRFDKVELLRTSPGDVGHGRNDLVLGPDGYLYLIHGNDTKLPADYRPAGSPYQHYDVDRPLPCEWNKQLFNYGAGPPAGHVVCTDREGRHWGVICGGFRNAYGIDFNPDGELFTFDADMEWDVGLPWYRPCRVNHIVSGGEYGWRQGVNKWPAWYPDSLPSTLDIGLASPTAVRFGTRSNFPPRLRRALFILDWAYGRILAVHFTPQGASYSARAETFLRGRPLNVTDLEFGPDGAMYFTTGGRRTQAGLYRVRYVGPPVEEAPPSPQERERDRQAAAARAVRRSLEAFHGRVDAKAVDAAWPHLASDDIWLRHAARVAIEHQPPDAWQDRALTEKQPTAALVALLALSRVGGSPVQPRLLARLEQFPLRDLPAPEKLLWLRTATLSCIRHGRPPADVVERLAKRVAALLPDAAAEVNQLACELLAYFDAAHLPAQAISLLAKAKTQEEKAHYLYVLRSVRSGWTPALRRQYFRWLGEANAFDGARYVHTTIDFVKQDALAAVPAAERAALAPLLVREPPKLPALPDRKVVRAWGMDDLAGSLESIGRGRDLVRGKAMFDAALCSRCHKFGGYGQPYGPDLTAVAARFGRRDLLESILSPSKAIDDKYRAVIVETADGRTLTGTLTGGDDEAIQLAADALAPDRTTRVLKKDIAAQQFSLVSPMPSGTLNTLTKEEILDLLAYLESSGRAK